MSVRILIVEDDPLTLLLHYNLEKEGFLVEAVARGDEAEIRRELAAEIVPKLSPNVVFSVPASTSRDTSFRSRPCSAISAVPNIERVNMNSQCGGHALLLEERHIETRRIIDQRETALKSDQLADLGQVLVRVGGREHEARCPNPEPLHLGRERLRVVDHVVRAEPAAPFGRLRPRCGRDNGQIRQPPNELGGNRADPTGATDDQNG